jgi:predicted nucleic acid-binding protein
MKGSSLVVADTTPLNYLTIIGQVHILGALFGKVLIPWGVLADSDTRRLRMRWRARVNLFQNGRNWSV